MQLGKEARTRTGTETWLPDSLRASFVGFSVWWLVAGQGTIQGQPRATKENRMCWERTEIRADECILLICLWEDHIVNFSKKLALSGQLVDKPELVEVGHMQVQLLRRLEQEGHLSPEE